MKYKQRILIGLLILLVATFFRLWMFGDVPPSLQHDEIFKAEEGIHLIEQGDFRLFYPTNQGHEGAFVWMLGISYLIVGINPLMIKLPAFIFGMLTVALIFRFGYRTYSPYVGVVASGLTAVSFWAVFTSRLGLRAVMLPTLVLIVLIGLSHILKKQKSTSVWVVSAFTGLALGFTIYTYTSSFALPLAYGVMFLILFILRRDLIHNRWRELLLVGILGAVITLPMVYIRLNDPQGSNRAESIATPLQEAQAGNPQLLIDNAYKLAGMPAFVGDPTWRYNIPGRPLFLLPIGLLVYVGFMLTLIHSKRQPLNILLIALLCFGLIPSLLTVLAPSFLRSIITLPAMMIFVGLAISQFGSLIKSQHITWGLIALIITSTAIADYQAYFVTWASQQHITLPYHDDREQGEGVYEIYRDDLEQLANYIAQQDEDVVFVSTPNHELDPLIYKYLKASSDNTYVVFFDAFANIVLSEHPALLFISPLSSISEKHQKWITPEYGSSHIDTILRQDGEIAFEVYRVSDTNTTLSNTLIELDEQTIYHVQDGEKNQIELPINFGDMLLLRGVEIPRTTVYGENDGVNNQLYLEPLVQSSGATLQIFLHLIDDMTQPPVAQRDLLGVSPAYWHPNIIFIQDNFVPFWGSVPPNTYKLVMGVYDVQTGQRLPVLDKNGQPISDHIILAEIEVLTPQ